MICIDTNFLGLVVHPKAKPPLDPNGKSIDRLSDRIEYMVSEWQASKQTVLIPTPVIAEFLVLAGTEAQQYLEIINQSSYFEIVDFDLRAAVEVAQMQITSPRKGKNSSRTLTSSLDSKAKVKFDRQIVGVAITRHVSAIYSDDDGVRRFANNCNLKCISSWELPLPPAVQDSLPF